MAGKKNVPLIIGLLLPVLLLAFLAGAVYIPRLLAPPLKHSFLYLSEENRHKYTWRVEGAGLKKVLANKSATSIVEPIYIYDAKTKTSRTISEADALKLRLSTSLESPDGYEIDHGRSGGIMRDLFVGYDRRNITIRGHGTSQTLELQGDDAHYYWGFEFLGWVIE